MPGSACTYSVYSGATSGTRSSEDRLCRTCTNINFGRYLGRKIKGSINLGPWRSICLSLNCPFCRLVKHHRHADLNLTPRSPGTEVLLSNELSWKLGIGLSPYDRSKSESYFNKFNLQSKASQCPNAAYRFVVFAEGDSDDGLDDSNREQEVMFNIWQN